MLQETEVVLKDKDQLRSIKMKNTFGETCKTMFIKLRERTLKLRERFDLPKEIDDDLNCLCFLPIDTFEELIGVENYEATTTKNLKVRIILAL